MFARRCVCVCAAHCCSQGFPSPALWSCRLALLREPKMAGDMPADSDQKMQDLVAEHAIRQWRASGSPIPSSEDPLWQWLSLGFTAACPAENRSATYVPDEPTHAAPYPHGEQGYVFEELPELEFAAKDGDGVVLPPGVASLTEWGQTVIQFGKKERKTIKNKQT